jgi:hypothetical protein
MKSPRPDGFSAESKMRGEKTMQMRLPTELRKEKLRLKRFTAASAAGLSNWKIFTSNHREALAIPADPQ